MKNYKFLVGLTALLSSFPLYGFTAPVARAQTIDVSKVLDALRSTVRVSGNAEVYTDYGEYTQLSNTEEYSIDTIYGFIENEGGTKTYAAVDMSLDNPRTYYEGTNHNVWTDYLMPDNTVSSEEVKFYGMPQTFARTYPNPWDYIISSDILDDSTLNPEKANLILSDYFGLDFAVESADLSFSNDGLLSGLEITCLVKPGVIGSTNVSYNVEQTCTASLEFSYPETELSHLSPRTTSNPELETAMDLGKNYTSYITGSNFVTGAVLYYVADYTSTQVEGTTMPIAYLHMNAWANHPVAGDYFFADIYNEGTYAAFAFDGKEWKNDASLSNVTAKAFAPRIGEVSASLFDRISTDTYVLDNAAATYSASYLGLPTTFSAMGDDEGVSGQIILKDGKVYASNTTYELGYNVQLGFSDYGSTVMPAWLDLSEIDDLL